MRQAGLLVWRAHDEVAKIIRPGVTTAEIDAVIKQLFAEHNATPLFKNYPNTEKGKPPFPACTCTSVNEVVVHGIPNNVPLVEGDIVSVDTGCRLNGWCGDAAVTYRIGQVSPAVDRLVRVTEETFFLAYKLMSTKTRWSQIAVEMSRFVRDHGYSTVECFVGHGVGRQMHEEPQVPNFLSRNLRGQGDFRIEPGLVIAVEPMVNMGTKKVKLLKDHWTQITTDKKPSAHYEHTIAVTRDGPRLLTEAPTPAEMELVLA
jgi:methionyl aminopeptidase